MEVSRASARALSGAGAFPRARAFGRTHSAAGDRDTGRLLSRAGKLGNTPTICRKCYVHPEVLNSYMDGNLVL